MMQVYIIRIEDLDLAHCGEQALPLSARDPVPEKVMAVQHPVSR